MKNRFKKQFCIHGHDTFTCGRTGSHNCTECGRIARQDSRYKEKRSKYMKRYIKLNKESIRKRAKKRYLAHPEIAKDHKLKQIFNITLEDYNKILKKQKNRCIGCNRHSSEFSRAFCVDHDHKCCSGLKSCGKCVRGLLCADCNLILGHAKDNIKILKKLIKYLQKS